MKTFRIVFNENDIPSDFIGECECPMCGNTGKQYGTLCDYCGHSLYLPCLTVDETSFTEKNGYTPEDIKRILALEYQDFCAPPCAMSNIEAIIRLT